MSTNSFLKKEATAEKMAMITNGVQRLWSRRRRGLLLESSWWADAATSRWLQGRPSQWPLGSCRRCPFDSCALFPHFCSVFPMAHYSDSPSREFGELTIRKSISRSSTVSQSLVYLTQIQKHLSPCHQGSWQLGYKYLKILSKWCLCLVLETVWF